MKYVHHHKRKKIHCYLVSNLKLILVEILDPPIMQVIGLIMLDVIFFNALISKSN